MNNEKILESYVATSEYTIRALEAAIMELKEAVRKSGSRYLIPVFEDRIEELENHLAVITCTD